MIIPAKRENIILGYLGPQGTYSEEAAKSIPGRSTECFSSIEAVIRAVDEGLVAEGIIPIENSLEGSVNITLDLLAHEVNLYIVGEVTWPIQHNLLVKPGSNDLRVVISHPQALAQCRKYLQAKFPTLELRNAASTAQAACIAADDSGQYAAIGSRSAADLYGLDIMAANIQDNEYNCTRFVIIGKHSPKSLIAKTRYKTSLVCQIDGSRPGSLCEILQEFAVRNVNLTKIESRPARRGLGIYIFFLDVDGQISDDNVQAAVSAVKLKSSWFKNLGSYPML